MGAQALFTKAVIVDYRNNAWKFQPVAQVTPAAPGKYPATFANTRTTAPDAESIGAADLKVGSFNVLNYFTSLGADVAGCTSFNDRAGNPIAVNSCPGNGPRGAWDTENFKRQQSKIVKAINALDADVVGLMEIENSAVVEGQPDAAVAHAGEGVEQQCRRQRLGLRTVVVGAAGHRADGRHHQRDHLQEGRRAAGRRRPRARHPERRRPAVRQRQRADRAGSSGRRPVASRSCSWSTT